MFPASRILRGEQNPKYVAEVDVVNVFATVRNRKRQIVRGLTKDDFVLEEEGRPQIIRYFSRETDLPLSLGLLVDTSGSQWRVLGEERSASGRFFKQVLRAGKDRTFVVRFDREVELLQDFTDSHDQLNTALSRLDTSEPPQHGAREPGAPRGYRFNGTALYDAVMQGSERLRARAGRKALIILSNGVDNFSRSTLAQAIEAAQHADTIAYSAWYVDRQINDPDRRKGRDGLRLLSQETGGTFFQVAGGPPIRRVFDRIQEELRGQYSLGYTSDRVDAGPGYRKIRLTTRRAGLTVQARHGYYALR